MSLSWRNRTRIALCADRVIVLRTDGRKVVSRDIHACAGNAVTGTLETLLADPDLKKTDATLILSSHFVKFMVLPLDASLSMAEQRALAQHRFSEVYGEPESGWEIRLSEGNPVLASAVEKGFLETLKLAFDASGVRLKSMQPYLMTAFNAARGQMKEDSAWFVLAEPGICCIARLQDGQWQGVRLSRGAITGAQLEREAMLAASDADRTIYLCAPENPDARIGGNWKVQALHCGSVTGIPTGEAGLYAMASVGM